jgi:hypothetical protein
MAVSGCGRYWAGIFGEGGLASGWLRVCCGLDSVAEQLLDGRELAGVFHDQHQAEPHQEH